MRFYLGITTIVAPISWLAVGTGASIILANVVSRYSILAIETGSGDRHLVSGSESNLLKLCLIVDRGSTWKPHRGGFVRSRES
ncbi:MAG: hypothetical protein Ct9H90mP26_1910 [Methanobacteriota archaeon]|nr:MAG: hypothetical protein Ct9H90mP26_1910 [Euryarchaeota archaeon]